MFQVNDVVVYGNHGVCKITDVGPLSMSLADKDTIYYTLCPVYQRETLFYAPVDNQKVLIRPLITKEEAERLIENIPNIDSIWITNEKERESLYKSIIKTCDCKELIKIIKTLYQRKESRIQDGKKITSVDERYFRMVEGQLYEELAYALGIEKEAVVSYIAESVQKKK